MKDFNIFWGSLKNPIEGDFLKRGTWTVCRFRGEGGRGGLARKRLTMFLRGVDTPMHTMVRRQFANEFFECV